MGRFAAIVLLFAFIFAMMVPSEFALSSGDEGLAPPPAAIIDPAEQEAALADDQSDLQLSDTGLTIERGPDGQFHMNADINGQQVPFLVDTGADHIALTVESARRIGLAIDEESFEPVGMGAGGVVEGQRVRLDSVRVAGHDIGEIDAVVLDGLTKNLLGQSVLREVASLELAGDTMTIN